MNLYFWFLQILLRLYHYFYLNLNRNFSIRMILCDSVCSIKFIMHIILKQEKMGKIQNSNNSKNRVRNQHQIMTKSNLRNVTINKIKSRLNTQKKQTCLSRISKKQKFLKAIQKIQLNQIIDQKTFECPICLEIMIKPTLLECGHAYCAKCLQELMIYKCTCGVCRRIQTDPQFKSSQILENMIENFITKKSQNSFDYYIRLTDTQNWRKNRSVQIKQLCKGEFVDFRDKELRWRKGEITKVLYKQVNQSYAIQLTYKKGEEIISEELSQMSSRIAKLSYYTKMKYLETAKVQTNIIEQNQVDQIFNLPLSEGFINMDDELDNFFFNETRINEEQNEQNEQFGDLNSLVSLHRLIHRQSLTDILQNRVQQVDAFFQILS